LTGISSDQSLKNDRFVPRLRHFSPPLENIRIFRYNKNDAKIHFSDTLSDSLCELGKGKEFIMVMKEPSIERREQTRIPCNPPLQVLFQSPEGSFSAFVEDISPAGARLRIPNSNKRIPFLLQGEIDYTLFSEKNTSHCHGKTAWVQRIDNDFVWGIEFITIDEVNNTPRGLGVCNTMQPVAI
jgi:hypothetical protein